MFISRIIFQIGNRFIVLLPCTLLTPPQKLLFRYRLMVFQALTNNLKNALIQRNSIFFQPVQVNITHTEDWNIVVTTFIKSAISLQTSIRLLFGVSTAGEVIWPILMDMWLQLIQMNLILARQNTCIGVGIEILFI